MNIEDLIRRKARSIADRMLALAAAAESERFGLLEETDHYSGLAVTH